MSERAGFKFKLNKKPKSFNNKEEAKRSVKNGGVFSENSYSKTRKLKDADDGRRNRVGSGKLTSFKIHKNSESTHRRVSSEKHSKNFKGDLNKGRRSYGKASPPLEDVTSTSRNPKNVGRSVKTVAETDSSLIESLKKDDADANVRAKWTKRIGRDRKTLKTDSEVVDDKPKKKKRVIRLDPYDTSNKRLDDGIAIDESKKDKKKDLEETGGISKNAQFRGIQPSPSIIAYVEDNLLGRRRTIEIQRAGYNTELPCPLDNTPFSTNSERERIEGNIFRNKLQFFAAAKVSSSFPPPDMPEIAFAGRSNVGKSSLLNALTRQWGVVRTSDKPGHTQSINFFELGSKLCLVDLPGYGFAYAKEEVKEAWEDLVKEYVSTRVGLKRVCLLIDTKWGMKPRDNELIDLMERILQVVGMIMQRDCMSIHVHASRSQTRYQIVLTKTDTVFPMDVARRAMQIEENLKANRSIVQPVMMASSKSGAGIGSLRTVLSKIARFAKL